VTTAGWALRRAGLSENDGCESNGQHIPFKTTKADRLAAGDARRSVEERYPSFEKYFNQIERPVDNMVRDRLLLCEDAGDQLARLIQAGLAAGVPQPRGQGEVKSETPLCHNDKRE
jgi:hypothetical protein